MRFNLDITNESYKNIETVMQEFSVINEEYQKQKSEACKKFKAAFESFVSDFFTLVPSVKRVKWSQYTPYFNDGDSCSFGINEAYFYNFINDEDYDEDDDDEEDDSDELKKGQWELNTWHLREYQKYNLTEQEQKLIQFLNDVIFGNEDFLYEMYGDHQEITLTAKGIDSDDYEHD